MDARRRVGVIVPSSNTVVELDFQRANPGTISAHFARAFLAETTPAAEQMMIERHVPPAAIDLRSAKVEILAFACTSAAAMLGVDGERKLIDQLTELAGAPVVSTNEAVARSLEAADAGRVAVLTAYVDELNQAIGTTLRQRGVEVGLIEGMGITDNYRIAEVTPAEIVEFAEDRLHLRNFDTLFISCTNLRAMEATADLEKRFGKPVVTSNSATIAAVLAAAGR
jgi:maleate isomerase